MGTAVGRIDPVFDSVILPGRTQRVFIEHYATDAFDEGLYVSFNWVLMLMPGGSWFHVNTVGI